MPEDKTTPFDAQWLSLQPWQVALLLVPCRCKSPVKLVWTRPGDFPAVVCTACNYGVVDNTIESVVLRHNRTRSLDALENKTSQPAAHFPMDPEPLHLAVALMAQLLQQDEIQDGIDALVLQGKLPRDNQRCTHRAGPAHCAGLEKDFAELSGTLANLVLPLTPGSPWNRQPVKLASAESKNKTADTPRSTDQKSSHNQALKVAKDKLCKLSREQVITRMAYQDFSFLGEKAMMNISPVDWCRLAQDRLAQLDEQERREADQRARRAKPPGVKTATVKKPTRTTVKKGVVPEPPARKSVQARVPDNAGKNDEAQAAHIPPKGTVILVPGSDDAVAAQKVAQKAKVLEEQNKAKEQDDTDPRATEALQAKLRSIARLALQRSGDILVRSQTQLIWVLYNEQGNLYEIRNILGKPHDFVLSKVKNYDCAPIDSTRCPSSDMEAVLGIQTMGPNNQVVGTVWYDRVDLRPRGDAVIPGPTLQSIVDSTTPAQPEKEVSNA